MTRRELIDYCLTFADCYEDYPFDKITEPESWTVMRHKGNRKSFALIFERDKLEINLKCEPQYAEFLRSVYPAVTPGYHMNHTHWNTVTVNEIPLAELYGMIRQSFDLTKGKIVTPKKMVDK